ncbi:MAG: MFS transporter [Armatimonadota bacterium]|nr:MFS transporter [Armatimonadota bacterium]
MAEVKEKALRWTHGLTGYHYLVLLVACCGWAFDTMDQWLYVLAKGPAMRDLMAPLTAGMSPEEAAKMVKDHTGTVQTIFILGWATGGFLFGMIGDKLGRTRTMAITVLLYAGFTGATALAQTWQQFALFRFLVGLGVGGEFAAGAALVAEVFPNHARTTALGIMQAASAVGNMTAGFINLTVGANPALGWRWVFAVGLFPALLVFVIRLFVREPDRWHQAKADAAAGKAGLGSIPELFSRGALRRNTLVGVSLAAVGVIGFWGIGTWSPELLRQAENPQNFESLKKQVELHVSYSIMAQNAGAFFGILTWAYLAQRIGRLRTFALTFIGCAVIVPATFHFTHSFAHALFLFPLMGFVTTSLFGGYAVYFPELYPTRLRATGTGFCYNTARYIAAVAPMLFGRLSGLYGIQWAATIVSVVFVLGLLILPFAEETRGKPLPE